MSSRAKRGICFSLFGPLALAAIACQRSTRANAAELALAAAASDSLTQAVADSLGPSGGFIVSQQGGSSETLNACNDHTDAAGWQSVGSRIIETEVPSDFNTGAQTAQSASWSGAAGTLRASSHRGAAHAWWASSITSECDVFISGSPAHVDLVSTTYSRSVYAYIQVRDAPPIELEGQSNSVMGQAQLLHSIRTARISAAWGR